MSTHTITEFLEARIAEDEAMARAVAATVAPDAWENPTRWGNFFPEDITFYDTQTPYRVLAECAAKRAIIADTYWSHKERPTDAELHASSSNPAWEYETTEGPRKRWDDADEPPEGEGWERNTDKGRDGWDRWEYTEESYWRRLKPEAERKEWRQHIPAALRALAAVYADHPDYDPEWAL